MSDDEELLQFAAKAAGYWCYKSNCVDYLPRMGWDPRDDDGDALRLAATLGLSVLADNSHVCAFRFDYASRGLSLHTKPFCDNRDAAWRLVIFLAAAEIGKTMNNSTNASKPLMP